MSGLRVPGSLNVSLKELLGVGIYTLEHNLLFNVFMYEVASIARTKANGSMSFTNFIESELDLNSKISYTPSSSENQKDDAYGLQEITISSTNSVNTKYSLPTAANIIVEAGEIDAQDPSNVSLGKFPVSLTISCDDQGLMTSSIAISGQDVYGTEVDNPNLAQHAYWPAKDNVPNLDADSADVLSAKITSAELTTLYSSQLQSINNQYNNQNMIKSWTITVNAIPSTTDNVLSQHARYLEKRGDTNVFDNGDKMVASTPFSYGITIDDYLDNPTTIITPTNVYGVISHKA